MNNQLSGLKLNKIAAILIGTILSVAIIFGFFKLMQSVFTRAEDVAPIDVITSEISQNSVKVTWATGQETQAVIEYGTTPTALNFFAPEALRTKSHSVDLTLLSPSTTYYFQIRVGEKKYDNGGVPWTFATKGVEKTQTPEINPTASPITPTASAAKVIKEINVSEDNITLGCPEGETDCQKIKDKIGKGCTTQDYFKCVMKLSVTPTIAP